MFVIKKISIMIFKWKIEILLVVLVALICDNNVIGQNVVPIRKCCKENEVSYT